MEGNEKNVLTITLAIIGVIILLGMMFAIFNMVQSGNEAEKVRAACNDYWIEQIKDKGNMDWLVVGPDNFSVTNYSGGQVG